MVTVLVPAALLATGTFGVDCLHMCPDRHVRRGIGVNQAEAGLEFALGALKFGRGEFLDIVVAGHAVSRKQWTTLPPPGGKKYDHSLLSASTSIRPRPFSA